MQPEENAEKKQYQEDQIIEEDEKSRGLDNNDIFDSSNSSNFQYRTKAMEPKLNNKSVPVIDYPYYCESQNSDISNIKPRNFNLSPAKKNDYVKKQYWRYLDETGI